MSPNPVDGDQRWGKEWLCPSGGLGHLTALTPSTHTLGPKRRVRLEKANPDYPQQICGTREKKILACSDYPHLQDWGRLPVYTEIQYVSVGTASRPNRVLGQAVGSAAGSVRRCDCQRSHPQASPHAAEPRGERAACQCQAKHQAYTLSTVIHTVHVSISHGK